jgi:hypothetical protein
MIHQHRSAENLNPAKATLTFPIKLQPIEPVGYGGKGVN